MFGIVKGGMVGCGDWADDVVSSGCSTLLRTIAGETNGTFVDEKSYVNYQGMGKIAAVYDDGV